MEFDALKEGYKAYADYKKTGVVKFPAELSCDKNHYPVWRSIFSHDLTELEGFFQVSVQEVKAIIEASKQNREGNLAVGGGDEILSIIALTAITQIDTWNDYAGDNEYVRSIYDRLREESADLWAKAFDGPEWKECLMDKAHRFATNSESERILKTKLYPE